VALELTSK
jgi:NADPH-ferrihemoprotein reductase